MTNWNKQDVNSDPTVQTEVTLPQLSCSFFVHVTLKKGKHILESYSDLVSSCSVNAALNSDGAEAFTVAEHCEINESLWS